VELIGVLKKQVENLAACNFRIYQLGRKSLFKREETLLYIYIRKQAGH
jgi:hypothetical protein